MQWQILWVRSVKSCSSLSFAAGLTPWLTTFVGAARSVGWVVGVPLAFCKIHLMVVSHQHIKCTIYNVCGKCNYSTHNVVMVDKKEQNTTN